MALGYHTGHWEVGLLDEGRGRRAAAHGCVPFAGYCTDPCDGRTQGTPGMMDSLPYRNDAAMVLRRLIRSLPTRKGVIGVATCDKGLPAMMMALAGMQRSAVRAGAGRRHAAAEDGEDAGKVQTIGARFAHGEITLEEAAEVGAGPVPSRAAAASSWAPRPRRRWWPRRWAWRLPHGPGPLGSADLARHGPALGPGAGASWPKRITMRRYAHRASIRNAMVVHAAFGGSTNLLLHIPAIAYAAGLRRPTVEDWIDVNRRMPRLVDALPNGPVGHPTVRVFLAGGVPEVMLHLRRAGAARPDCLTVTGESLGDVLDWWENAASAAGCAAGCRSATASIPTT